MVKPVLFGDFGAAGAFGRVDKREKVRAPPFVGERSHEAVAHERELFSAR